MGKLTDMLKSTVVEKVKEQPKQQKPIKIFEGKKNNGESTGKEDYDYFISPENLRKIRDSVEDVPETKNMTRRELVIRRYGSIKDPTTGKRFVIPDIDFKTPDFNYKYAEMMRLLVDKPQEFYKIMCWE